MDSKIRIMMLAFLFSIYSCGWIEKENIKEIQLSQGYNLYYDTSNIAYNYISIVSKEGVPLLNDCEELYICKDYLYAKVYKENANYEYYKINNMTKKIFIVTTKEYLKDIKKFEIIEYKELRDRGNG